MRKIPERPNYQLEDNPVYTEEVPALLDTDPASATNTFNPLFLIILNNIKASHQLAEAAKEAADKAAENGGYVYQDTPPDNNGVLWFDSAANTIKYYDATDETWKPIPAGTAWHFSETTQQAGGAAPEGARSGDYVLDTAGNIFMVGADLKLVSAAQGASYLVQSSAPENTGKLWVDTGNGNALKYYNGSAWVLVPAVWG